MLPGLPWLPCRGKTTSHAQTAEAVTFHRVMTSVKGDCACGLHLFWPTAAPDGRHIAPYGTIARDICPPRYGSSTGLSSFTASRGFGRCVKVQYLFTRNVTGVETIIPTPLAQYSLSRRNEESSKTLSGR